LKLPDEWSTIGKKYNIIYADPAWSYRDKALAGNRGAESKYQVMSVDEIKKLPVETITHDDCILFMWATFPNLREALDVIDAWGFDYKTVGFTWVKKTKNGHNFMGMGNYTRSNAEVCLIARKGKIKRIDAGIRQIIESIPERHSKKPDIVRDKIVDLVGELPRVELFARNETDGWDVWGNEV